MKKSEAMARINSHAGRVLLNGKNARFASMNKSKSVWWLNVPLEMAGKDLHIILKRAAKGRDGSLIWLTLPAGTLSRSKFRYWQSRGAIDLEIGAQGASYLKDIKSDGTRYDFSPQVVKEVSCAAVC